MMNANDVIFYFFLIVTINLLAGHYLTSNYFSAQFRFRMRIICVLLVSFPVLFNEITFKVVGMGRLDAESHDFAACLIAANLSWTTLTEAFQNVLLGNQMFELWIGILYFIIGITHFSAESLGTFMCAWGILMLIRYIVKLSPNYFPLSNWLLLLFVLPSILFWSLTLLKEPYMFWAICAWYTGTTPISGQLKFKVTNTSIVGCLVGLTMRPYVMIIWVMAVGFVVLLRNRRFITMVVMVIAMAFALGNFKQQLEIRELREATDYAVRNSSIQANYQGEGSGSNFSPGPLGISGLVALFIRPFPWEANSIVKFLSAFEIWMLSLFILASWFSLSLYAYKGEVRNALKEPSAQVSILVCLCFCLLFSFTVNEGQVSRARVQAFPALITLAYLPWSRKRRKMARPMDCLGKSEGNYSF